MAAYFFDASALVKRYSQETGTSWVLRLFRHAAGNRLYAARITGVEAAATLARKRRGSRLRAVAATRAAARLRRDFNFRLRVVEITPTLLAEAMTLAESHFLRGYDAVQLAAALEANTARTTAGLAPLILIAADTDLLDAATREGLATDNPNLH